MVLGIYTGGGVPWHAKKMGVFGAGKAQKGGLLGAGTGKKGGPMCGHNQKNGVLGGCCLLEFNVSLSQ